VRKGCPYLQTRWKLSKPLRAFTNVELQEQSTDLNQKRQTRAAGLPPRLRSQQTQHEIVSNDP
jgi:hypothetical protein